MAKRLLLFVVSLAYFAVAEGYRALLQGVFKKTVTRRRIVLTYHSVHKDEAARFDIQMQEVKCRTTPVFAEAAVKTTNRQEVAVTFDDGFQNVYENAIPITEMYAIPVTMFVPTGFLGSEPAWITDAIDLSRHPGPVMSANTLSLLNRAHVKIGSHTVTHPRLGRLQGRRLNEELARSKSVLEQITGQRVSILSLPYGSYTHEVIAAADQAGYERVFANTPLGRLSPSLLAGRINTSPHDWEAEFALKIRGAYEWLGLAIPIKRAIVSVLRGRRGSWSEC